MLSAVTSFSATYDIARRRFLQAAREKALFHETMPHPQQDPLLPEAASGLPDTAAAATGASSSLAKKKRSKDGGDHDNEDGSTGRVHDYDSMFEQDDISESIDFHADGDVSMGSSNDPR